MKKHRWQFKFLFTGAVMFAAILTPLEAGTVSTSVACSTNLGNIANLAACSLLGAGTLGTGHATASASVSYLLTASGLTTTANASADAAPSVDLTTGKEAASFADSNASITLQLDTAGAVRQGYVLVDWNATENSCCGVGGGTVSFSLGSGVGGNCSAPPTTVCSYSLLEPITLGSDFVFTEAEQFQATTLDEHDGGSLQASLTLQFLELDGKTPVAVFQTPEPTPLALAALGLFCLLGLRRIPTNLPGFHKS